jgi:hypothetical protein
MTRPPAFIAFTGVDRLDILDGMKALSARYPIEWGVLVDDTRAEALFPPADIRAALLQARLRFAAHICGEAARAIVRIPQSVALDLHGVSRIQVNHGFAGSTPEQLRNAALFGRRNGVRVVLQCQDSFPADATVDWLYDVSFGTGKAPAGWPPPPAPDGPFCGYSGGINPDNVRAILDGLTLGASDAYWIDMESGVRSGGFFDLAKCEAVCRQVYG